MHTYILIFPRRGGGAWMRCFRLPLVWKIAADAPPLAPAAELNQKCILASELFTYRCMIMISRLIRDKIRRRPPPSFGALEVTCFFPR